MLFGTAPHCRACLQLHVLRAAALLACVLLHPAVAASPPMALFISSGHLRVSSLKSAWHQWQRAQYK